MIKVWGNLRRIAAIAQELSASTIRCVEDLWSREKIEFRFDQTPVAIDPETLKEIIFKSFAEYLNRPGHVLLPDGFLPDGKMNDEQGDALLRVRMLWVYWHGTQHLDESNIRPVSTVPNSSPHLNGSSQFPFSPGLR